MATKANILTTINGFITAVVNITKVRSAFSTLTDNIYPTLVYDDETTTNVFTKFDDDFQYNFKISKTGRNVNICGRFIKVTSGAVSNKRIVNITNSEFLGSLDFAYHNIPAISESGLTVFLTVPPLGTFIRASGTVPQGVEFLFNGTYTVKD